MAYSSVVRRLLISCPGDVPSSDLQVVQRAINRWNGVYGEAFGAVILPISWGTHAAAEFGGTPQDLLNRQLVDRCDICLALFANRLGTPTESAESGTAEEIARISKSGRYVAILRSRCATDTSRIDLEQAKRLQEYLDKISANALVLDYSNDAELSQRVDTILAAAVARDQGRADLQLEQAPSPSPTRVAEVWPRVDSSEEVTTIGNKLSTRRRWRLVLANTGSAPARDVSVKLEPEDDEDKNNVWLIIGESREADPRLEILAPHGEVAFGLIATIGMASQLRCIVSWRDDRGQQKNVATLRLA